MSRPTRKIPVAPKECSKLLRMRGGPSDMLRAMPVNERAEALVGMFSIVVSEFAKMVLEHVEPAKPTRKPPAAAKRRMRRRA